MNRQSIQDIDAALDKWHRRLTRAVNEINALRLKRKKMLAGYLKSPPPPGVVIKFGKPGAPNPGNDFSDPTKDLFVAPGTTSPC